MNKTDPLFRGSRQRGAFTLIELLLVIGIIAVLIALLLPALLRVRRQALSLSCASNLHQIGIGLATYEADFKGYLPPLGWGLTYAEFAYVMGDGTNLDGLGILQGRGYLPIQSTIFHCPLETQFPSFMWEGVGNWHESFAPNGPNDWVFMRSSYLGRSFVGYGNTSLKLTTNMAKLKGGQSVWADDPWMPHPNDPRSRQYPPAGGINVLCADGSVYFKSYDPNFEPNKSLNSTATPFITRLSTTGSGNDTYFDTVFWPFLDR